jgi:hypothetical protein
MARISFRCSEGFLARVDERRGGVPRERFVRGLVARGVGLDGAESWRPEPTVVRGLVEKGNHIQAEAPGVSVEFRRPGVRPAREFNGPYDPFGKR